MKPPVCEVCGDDFRMDASNGRLVYFVRTPGDVEWYARSRKEGFVGHPPNAAWFCEKHYKIAITLTHLTLEDALRRFSLSPVPDKSSQKKYSKNGMDN